jgi:hypothetical protein
MVVCVDFFDFYYNCFPWVELWELFFVLRIYIATGFVEGQSGGVVNESSNESDCDSSVG